MQVPGRLLSGNSSFRELGPNQIPREEGLVGQFPENYVANSPEHLIELIKA